MNDPHIFTVLTDNGNLKFHREDLTKHSDYFRCLLSSNLYESRFNQLDLRKKRRSLYSCPPPCDPTVLETIMQLLSPDYKRKITRSHLSFHMLSFFKTSIPEAKLHKSSLQRWLLRASGVETKKFLQAVNYFRFHDVIEELKHLGKRDAETKKYSNCDIKLTARLLHCAQEYDMTLLYETLVKTMAGNYLEFMRDICPIVYGINTETLQKIQETRTGARLKNNSVTAIFETDVDVSSFRTVSRCYALVEFKELCDLLSTDKTSLWQMRLIDAFSASIDEYVNEAVTIDNYLYLITSQYCSRKKETKIRVRRFDPFQSGKHNMNYDLSTGKQRSSDEETSGGNIHQTADASNLQKGQNLAWFTDWAVLVKKGFLRNFKAVVARCHDPSDGAGQHSRSYIYLLGAKQITLNNCKSCGSRTEFLSDVDRYDPIMNRWNTCTPVPIRPVVSQNLDAPESKVLMLKRRKKPRIHLTRNFTFKICETPSDDTVCVRVSYMTSGIPHNGHNLVRNQGNSGTLAEPKVSTESDLPEVITNNELSVYMCSYNTSQDAWHVQREADELLSNQFANFQHGNSSVETASSTDFASDSNNANGHLQQSENIRLDLKLDKTCKVDSNIIELVKTEVENGAIKLSEIVYRTPYTNAIYAEVALWEFMLMNASIAVPRLFNLYYPQV